MGFPKAFYIRVMEKERILKSKEKATFYQYINPVCLAVGIVGICLYFEVDYIEMAITGMGLWGVTGLLHMNAQKEKSKQ